MSDQDIKQLEEQFPSVSASAFAEARERVLRSGQSILQSENGIIYRVFPDGRREEVKKIDQPAQVVLGSVLEIK